MLSVGCLVDSFWEIVIGWGLMICLSWLDLVVVVFVFELEVVELGFVVECLLVVGVCVCVIYWLVLFWFVVFLVCLFC